VDCVRGGGEKPYKEGPDLKKRERKGGRGRLEGLTVHAKWFSIHFNGGRGSFSPGLGTAFPSSTASTPGSIWKLFEREEKKGVGGGGGERKLT